MSIDILDFADSINRIRNSYDIENFLQFYAPEFVGEDVGQDSRLRGHDDLRATLFAYCSAFSDLQFTITDCVVQGSRLAACWMAEGTHQGRIMNIPPTGRRLKVQGMFILDVKDGQIIHAQSVWDVAGMLRQLGLLPKL